MIKTIAFLFLAFVLSTCTNNSGTKNETAQTTGNAENDEEAVKAVVTKESRLVADGNIEAFSTIFHDDVEMMPVNAPSVKGNEAKKWMQGLIADYTIVPEPYYDEEITVSGDLAIPSK